MQKNTIETLMGKLPKAEETAEDLLIPEAEQGDASKEPVAETAAVVVVLEAIKNTDAEAVKVVALDATPDATTSKPSSENGKTGFKNQADTQKGSAGKRKVADKEAAQVKIPLPQNWKIHKEIEMKEVKELNLHPVEDRSPSIDGGRRRNVDPTTISLPTSEKGVSESLAEVSVDAVAERISTVIAVNCTNTGNIQSKEGVMVQGVQVGNITVDSEDLSETGTIVVSKHGVVRGEIEGKRIVILGRVEGSIRSHTHVTLGESAVVLGDVLYKTIRMHDGAEVDGKCSKMKDEA